MARPWSARRSLAALLALGALSAACGNAAESGVNVKTVATDLTYGIPPTPKPAAPANTTPKTTDPLGTVLEGGDFPEQLPPPPGPPANPCPPAPPTIFPQPAPATIAGVPKEGVYTWRQDGYQVLPALGRPKLAAFSRRAVSDVGTVNGGPKFTVEERELVVGSQFNVKNTYEYRVGGIDTSVEGANVDRTGLYLVKVERIHRTNPDANSEFNPSPPILVLPQPAVLGDSVSSTGVDPVSLEVLNQDGSITKRERVDACGKPQDAFYVETVQEFVGSDGTATRRKFNYGIATVMGGLPIVELIESPCVEAADGGCTPDAITFKLDAHIGQLEPS